MPTYIYKCEACEKEFKAHHGMNDVLTECIECHKTDSLKKLPTLLTSLPEKSRVEVEAGVRVKEAIEDNRKLLLDSKNELVGKKI